MVVRRLLAALVLLPVLVACSDKETGGPRADPSEPTSSPTVEPTPTESETHSLPPEIVGEDEPSAKAFVRYWFATLSTAMAQGDIESLRQVSGASCVTCRRWVTTIEGVFDSGGRYVTKGWKIQHLVGEPASGQTPVTYLITVREQRRSLLDADGRVVDVSPPTIRAMRMILRRDGDHWVARRLDVIE